MMSNAQCPGGSTFSNKQNWEAQFPTRAARQAHLGRCGSVLNRGPNCENVWFNPEVIKDPLPFREAKGKNAFGLNLDGTKDGAETEKTCAHEKFVSAEGGPGIDNQYYRFFGCHKSYLTDAQELSRRLVRGYASARLLMEITSVKDERNDDSVNVAMYAGRDELLVDASGNAVPFQSQRAEGSPFARFRGRIVDGLLITEPADVTWVEDGDYFTQRLRIRGMRLHLGLTATGTEGIIAGYASVPQLWQEYSEAMAKNSGIWGGSGPAAYAALHRLADGYKDSQTKTCTALSWARKYEFVRAYLTHPVKDSNL
jgi:hypothetical protein